MSGRAVLIGAGHAHLHLIREAEQFRRRGHSLTVVAPEPFWYSGLATGMLGGHYPPELDCIDVAALAALGGARFIRDRLIGLDRQSGLAVLEKHAPIPFDALSLNVGSVAPPIPGGDQPEVFSVKPISRLLELRNELRLRLRDARAPLRILIAGAGATGCELAGNIAALAADIAGTRPEIVVLGSGGAILKSLPHGATAAVRANLEHRGVALRGEARVARLNHGRAELENGEELGYDLFVNATGLEPAPITRQLGLPCSPDGALLVDRHLRSPADSRIHGGGDCAALEGRNLPRIGVYAIRQAPVLLHNLLALLDGAQPRVFTPQRHYLWIMNLGDGTGLAARGRYWWHGRSAFWLKDRIDRRFLSSYRPD